MQLYTTGIHQGKNNGKVQNQRNAIPRHQMIQIAFSQGMSSTLSAILPGFVRVCCKKEISII